ncbi:heat-inducible transcriptional repressor HrcA [Lysinibacillus telephonicus]|uniref:Heat-inducible transcription repressor HrcA n=1 Tax=Lysinibacillus telephonicus TaxID=1714840 RepID=A0A3S0HL48_9BACI|nr:heat-inducible transcriptional repressor HrcA [Lysinibacillus telephonicus]RTQ95619.1 heat-inducible transcriptional repressor HrcA [Lysinibacillus telephonicus]
MLTNRQLQILQVIVDDFVFSAQPVGSRQISKKEWITYSPATIRNEMADLEELGFLEKTHTSSGRVPSEKGYRFYVDHLLQPKTMSIQEIGLIQSLFQNQIVEMEQVIRESANILSDLTSYTTILLGPNVGKHRVKRFQIVPLTEQTAVAIIVTDNGHVENRTITLPKGFAPSDIEKTVNILNERLVGAPLIELQKRLELETFEVLRQHINTADSIIQSLKNVVTVQNEGKIYFGGKTNMLNQPEFHDLNKVRALMELMDKESQVISLFHPGDTGIHIRIGSENNHLAMEDLSVITATYSVGKEQEGSIAIIGPTRMDYQRVVSLLDIIRSGLSRVLSNKLNDGL